MSSQCNQIAMQKSPRQPNKDARLALLASFAFTFQYAFAQTVPVSPPIAPSVAAGPETSVTASQNESWMQGKYGLGSMSGIRTELSDAGVEPFLFYTSIFSGNPVGGARQGETYVDDFYFGANLFLKKLIGWEGAKLTITGVNRDGPGLTENYVHSRYDVQQTVGGQTIFFYQLFLEQRFWDDKASLKLGRFGASDDFNGSKIYGLYLNNGIDGDIRNVLFDTQFSLILCTWPRDYGSTRRRNGMRRSASSNPGPIFSILLFTD